MGRGPLVFSIVFLALPLLGLLGVVFIGGGFALALAAVVLLMIGFTIALPFVGDDIDTKSRV